MAIKLFFTCLDIDIDVDITFSYVPKYIFHISHLYRFISILYVFLCTFIHHLLYSKNKNNSLKNKN